MKYTLDIERNTKYIKYLMKRSKYKKYNPFVSSNTISIPLQILDTISFRLHSNLND